MASLRDIPCEHCGTYRNPDMRIPCPLCRSRNYLIIGYSYEHEARTVMLMLIVIGGILLLAIVLGAAFFIYTRLQLAGL